MSCYTSKLVIFNLPKTRITHKIKKSLKQNDFDIQWIPLQDQIVLLVEYEHEGAAKKLIETLETFRHLRGCEKLLCKNQSTPDSSDDEQLPDDITSILQLPDDCLYIIFNNCSLKMQIALAKVCQRFFYAIRDMWMGQFRTLEYNTHHFEFTERLSQNEINDFCSIVGPYVETLRFNSIFYFELMQKHLADTPGNLNENARNFINARLCSTLQYFENITSFEVQGKFLVDFTVKQLSRYCSRFLHTIRLLDWDSRFITGKYLHEFPNLEHLNLRACTFLTQENLRIVCLNLKLKTLDIAECEQLENFEFIEECCNHLQELTTFKTHWRAIERDETIAIILTKLTKLEHFEVHWITESHSKINITGILLQQLSKHKSKNIRKLKFINDRLPIENQSFSFKNQDAYKYALLRENSATRGREWSLDHDFDAYIEALSTMENLEELEFEYCRLFDKDNIIQIPSVCKNLRKVKLIGHPMKTDKELKEMWKKFPNCDLHLKSLVDFKSVGAMRSLMEKHRLSGDTIRYSATIRCVEIHFVN